MREKNTKSAALAPTPEQIKGTEKASRSHQRNRNHGGGKATPAEGKIWEVNRSWGRALRKSKKKGGGPKEANDPNGMHEVQAEEVNMGDVLLLIGRKTG